MARTRNRSTALFCALLVALSTFAAPAAAHLESGGTATASDAGAAPDVYVPAATINVSTPTTVDVAYNATGKVSDASVLELWLVNNDTRVRLDANETLAATAGVAALTVDAGEVSDNFTAKALLVNNSSSSPSIIATNESTFTVTGASGGGGGGGGGLPAAPYVNTSDRSLDPTTTSFVYVTYNATGLVPHPDNVSVAVRNDSSGQIVGRNATLSTTLGYANVSIPAGVGANPFQATIFLNTSTQSSPLTTDVANFTTLGGGGGGGGGGGATPVTLSENVSVTGLALNDSVVNESENFEVNVSLTNAGGVDETVSVTPTAFEWDNGTDGKVESWTTTKTVPQGSTVNATLVVNVSSYGGYGVTAGEYGTESRLKVLTDGTKIVLRNVYDNQAVVANESQVFFATAKNYGNQAGYANLSMEWGNGNVITWANTSTIAPGGTASTNFYHTFTQKGEYDVYFDHDGGRELMNVTVREDPVVASSFEIVSGPGSKANISLDAGLNANQVSIRLVNRTQQTELETTGVTAATKFRINVTLKNFTSRVLIGSARNASWDRIPINDTHTKLTIVGSPAEVQYMKNAPSIRNWPDDGTDQADYRRNLSVDFSAFSLDAYAGANGWANRVDGTLISTDAQTFGTPEFNASANGGTGALELEVAAPHLTVSGAQNDGFYEAQIPQSLLDHWNVTDVSALGANYQGSTASITANALPGGGAKVEVPLHYSSGTVQIAPTNAGTGGGNNDNGGTDGGNDGGANDGGTNDGTDPGTSDRPGTQPSDDETESVDDATSVSVSTSDVTESGGQTASASVANAAANSTVTVEFTGASGDASPAANATTALDALNVSLVNSADFDVSVTTSTDAPAAAATAGTPDGADVVSYVQVDHPGISNADVSGAELTIRVAKARFGSGFDPANAVVYRLHDGEWTALDTTLVGDSASHYRFRAASPGLSVFAVGVQSPDLTTKSRSLTTDTASIGEEVTVDVTVANDGTGQGEYTAELTVDGTVVTTKTVTVPAGESTTVSLSWEFGAGGEYALAVNGASVGTVTVEGVDRQQTTTTTQATTAPPSTETTQTTAETPGFGPVVALVAALGAALFARRRR